MTTNTEISQKPETIILNGMPFDQESVLKMPNGAQIWAEGIAKKAAITARTKVRKRIAEVAGDQASILGTTADVTQLNAAAILALVSAFKTGDTFPKFRAAFMTTIEGLVPQSEDGDVYDQASAFLAGVQNGDIVLTAALKGLPVVIQEMAERSTGVATVLAQTTAAAQ